MTADDYSISQISPKSNILDDKIKISLEYLSSSNYEPDLLQSSVPEENLRYEDSDDHPHARVERSASPILNGADPTLSSSFNDHHLRDVDHNDVNSEVSGRYFETIRPTNTFRLNDDDTLHAASRTAKTLEADHFLSKRGPRDSLGPLINPINATQTSPTVTPYNNGFKRQNNNNNPDIQDIITGIVKLLNGNVNVHANNQQTGNRRPIATRINNRGPPRISESQPIPPDDNFGGTTNKPVPYPFDRPDGPMRPFITGVPIPEQIVPSMQQNYRPGFISQNRLPWQRPRPRPPINNRRPLPQYKPIPLPEYRPEEDTTLQSSGNSMIQHLNITTSDEIDDDSHFDIVVSDEENSTESSESHYNETSSKIKEEENSIIESFAEKISPTVTTIIQTTSEVNLAPSSSSIFVQDTPSSVSSSSLEPSFTENIQATSAQLNSITPTLQTFNEEKKESSSIKTSSSFNTKPISSSTKIEPTSTSTKSTSMVLHPRPGIVLDDPDFKPGGVQARPSPNRNQILIQPTRPPGYGEIFDITLSAIQGPGGGGSKQTVNLNKVGGNLPQGINVDESDIIISPSGDQGSVFIDGKRTYIPLFGDSSSEIPFSISKTIKPPIVRATTSHNKLAGITGNGYAVAETDAPPVIKPQHIHRPHHRPRPQQPPVRIDTCIVGDDSTCDLAQNEKCKTENGVSSCHCRPGYARRKHREPCRRIVSLLMSLRVDRIYDRRVVWDQKLGDHTSEAYQKISYETLRAIDSAMSMTPFSDEFMEADVNRVYNGDASQGTPGVFVNITLRLEENSETLRPTLKNDIQRHLLGVIHRRNNNIGNSALFVESPPGSVTNLQGKFFVLI